MYQKRYNIEPPNTLETLLYAYWLQAKEGNLPEKDGSEKELEQSLKTHGFHPYTNGLGFPMIGHWYDGPIEVGMQFIWEPTKDDVCAKVTVHQVLVVEGGDKHIFTAKAVWNDESRFREACLPLDRCKER